MLAKYASGAIRPKSSYGVKTCGSVMDHRFSVVASVLSDYYRFLS